MDRINEVTESVEKFCKENEGNKVVELLTMGEEKTKVKRSQLALAGAAALAFFGFILCGMGLIASLVGFLYPAYASFKALETKQQDDDKKWLTYWVVYGLFSIIEHFTDLILFWLPFYFEMKIALLIWCMYPSAHNGSMLCYKRVIRPFLLKHEDDIDNAAANAAGKVVDAVVGGGEKKDD